MGFPFGNPQTLTQRAKITLQRIYYSGSLYYKVDYYWWGMWKRECSRECSHSSAMGALVVVFSRVFHLLPLLSFIAVKEITNYLE